MDVLLFYGYEILTSFVPFLITLLLFNLRKRKDLHIPEDYYIAVIFFAFYVIGVFHFTGVGTLYDGLTYQWEINKNQINLIPFSNDINVVPYLLNILLFVPLGILTPFIWDKMNRFAYLFVAGFTLSLCIELSQLLNNRRSDIDDLILNTFGTIIGFVLYKIWCKFAKGKSQLCFPPTVEFAVYTTVMFAGRFLLYNEIGVARLLYGF